jgi:peptidoglycan/xylan/chitin deacetylase (PgdA/CDA1 family)
MLTDTVVRWPSARPKAVALTFDDGPDPLYTPQVLDILAREHVRATFFDVGKFAKASPGIVKRQVRDGHIVGSHTYSHILLTRLGEADIKDEMEKGARAVEGVVGKKPLLFRPPYGRCNPRIYKEAKWEGYRMVKWDVCLERQSLRTPKELADRVVRMTEPGTIILIHDGRTRPTPRRRLSIAALPIVIGALKKQGYQFVTVPELLKMSGEKAEPYAPARVYPPSQAKSQPDSAHIRP